MPNTFDERMRHALQRCYRESVSAPPRLRQNISQQIARQVQAIETVETIESLKMDENGTSYYRRTTQIRRYEEF